MRHLKDKCIACERTKAELLREGIEFNKEHLSAEWLIKRTGTDKTNVRWLGKDVKSLSVTIPLCEECNTKFGDELELPVSKIFVQLENGEGITDYQAELLTRWMWRFEGLHWYLRNKTMVYSEKYTLKERILNDIDEIRPYLMLSVSRIKKINPIHGDKPMGIDSITHFTGLFVSGVFSEIAIMTSMSKFDNYIPNNFSKYKLKEKVDKPSTEKVFFPKIGFADDDEAVGITRDTSILLEYLHDIEMIESYLQ